MKMTTQDIPFILNLVFKANRPMPAKFNSDNGRSQTFGSDYPIPEDHEMAMAGQVWGMVDDYVKVAVVDKNVDAKTQRIILVILGENIMLGSYIAKSLHKEEHISELITKIYDRTREIFNEKN